METVHSIRPLLAVLASLLAVIPIALSARRPNLREGWTFLAGFTKFGLVVSMLPVVLGGAVVEYKLFEVLPGVGLAFRVDSMGMLFALVSSSLWIVTSAYSIGYMRGLDEHAQTRYFCFFAVALSATIGVAFSANLLTMYLFYEMLSLATYPIVTHHQDNEARISGRKYLTYILGTSIGFALPAMLYSYSAAGTLEFTAGGVFANVEISRAVLMALMVFFVFGFAKAGLMPVHSWLPAAMVAPTPVSALLHAVAVVKVGAFSIFRVVTGILGVGLLASFHLGVVLCYIASVTTIVSSLIALSQDDLKRRLAFSTIGQLSYIVLGAALLSPKGLTGGMVHIAMHAFGKITLFFCAGAIYVATGKRKISTMRGLGRKMPFTFIAFFIGSLSVIGLPPTGGFFSKWYLVMGTMEAGHPFVLAVLLTSSLLNAAYFLPIVFDAFFRESDDEADAPADATTGLVGIREKISEAPIWCLAPPVLTATISVALFFYPTIFAALALRAAAFYG